MALLWFRMVIGQTRDRGVSGGQRLQTVAHGAQACGSRTSGSDRNRDSPPRFAHRTPLYAPAAQRKGAMSHFRHFLRRILSGAGPHPCSTCEVMAGERCRMPDETGDCPR